ncbi:MAG: hypothetical protein LBM98_01445 [Oscillospiraceae bacterium]|nr:hypothetical protein [Oscillospiraceae bacterium]
MLRTCNALRIASVAVLRNDGAPGRRTPRSARNGEGGFETRPYERAAQFAHSHSQFFN